MQINRKLANRTSLMLRDPDGRADCLEISEIAWNVAFQANEMGSRDQHGLTPVNVTEN